MCCYHQASLDRLLLDSNGFIITPSSCLKQFVTQHMVQMLRQNFDQLTDLENQISSFCEDNEKSYARDVLLSQFSPVFKEVFIQPSWIIFTFFQMQT